MSLTITFAPARASSSAWVRPRPPPAPVTIAVRPCKETAMSSPFLVVGEASSALESADKLTESGGVGAALHQGRPRDHPRRAATQRLAHLLGRGDAEAE